MSGRDDHRRNHQSFGRPPLSIANIGSYALLFLVLVLAALAYQAAVSVETGYIGVKTRFGKVISSSLPAGLHFRIPFVEDIDQVEVREQKMEMNTGASSRDLQTIQSSLSLIHISEPTRPY